MIRTTSLTMPALRRSAIAVVASAGGIPALIDLLGGLPGTFPFPIIAAQHLPPAAVSILPEVLSWRTALRVKWAEHGERPVGGAVYLVPPGFKLEVRPDGFALSRLPPSSRAWLGCADVLFGSVADCYGPGAAGVVLSGMLAVGIDGIRAIRRNQGLVFAQSQRSSSFFDMPAGAIDLAKADIVLPPSRIAEALLVLADGIEESGNAEDQWLGDVDSNHDKQSQSLLSYR